MSKFWAIGIDAARCEELGIDLHDLAAEQQAAHERLGLSDEDLVGGLPLHYKTIAVAENVAHAIVVMTGWPVVITNDTGQAILVHEDGRRILNSD